MSTGSNLFQRSLTAVIHRHWEAMEAILFEPISSIHVIFSADSLWLFIRDESGRSCCIPQWSFSSVHGWTQEQCFRAPGANKDHLELLLLPEWQGLMPGYIDLILQKPSYHEVAAAWEQRS